MTDQAAGRSAYVFFSLAHNPSVALIQDEVRRALGGIGKYQDPATFHVTAVYINDISDHDLHEVLERTQAAHWWGETDHRSIDVSASRLGLFENGDERALHIVVEPSDELQEQQRNLYRSFSEAGYESELSPYSQPEQWKPHITLAYLPSGVAMPALDFELLCRIDAIVFSRDDYEVFGISHAKEHQKEKAKPMPWKIEKDGDKFCVHKADGAKVKCHDTKEDAEAHLKALYASEKADAKIKLYRRINKAYADLETLDNSGELPSEDRQQKMLWMPTQEETHYTPLSPDQAQLCGNCRWFNGSRWGDEPACHLIEAWPLDIVPTGHCDRWEAIPNPEPEPLPVTIVDSTSPQKSLMQRMADTFKNFTTRDQHIGTGFKVVGNYWVATWSNNFEDRDGEIFPAKAIDDYVWRADMGIVPPPLLQVWHLGDSTTIGQADWVGRQGHFLVAAGQFTQDEKAQAAKGYYTKNAHRTSLSHGFTFDETQFDGKHYHQFNTFEITLLPIGREANRYTTLDGVKSMKLTDEKVKYLKQVFGDERAAGILADLEKKGKALEELGAEYKDFLTDPDSSNETQAVKDAAEHADKTFGELLPELMEGSAEALIAALNAVKSVNELRGQIEAQNKQIDELRAELALSPRASQADATVHDDHTLKTRLQKEEVEEKEFNPFPGVNKGSTKPNN